MLYNYNGITMVLQWCYNLVKMILQWCDLFVNAESLSIIELNNDVGPELYLWC
jgi:hypothetical protein